jgi:predicted transposase/invertase (TIGR01784 family)
VLALAPNQSFGAFSKKDFDNLTLSDDFIFGAVMSNPACCKPLIEMIMGIKVAKIEYPDIQKSINMTYDAKGIRLDIYTEGDGVLYDLEMQTTVNEYLPKRSRYYNDLIDVNYLKKGEKYKKLPQCIVIFICLNDPFADGRACYTFENICLENKDLELKDGTRKIFLNAAGNHIGISKDLANFLDYLAEKGANDEYTSMLEQEVTRVKNSEDWRREYMTLEMKIDEEREQAREEGERIGRELGEELGKEIGKELGVAQQRVSSIDNLIITLNLTVESACKAIGIQPEEYEEAKRYLDK